MKLLLPSLKFFLLISGQATQKIIAQLRKYENEIILQASVLSNCTQIDVSTLITERTFYGVPDPVDAKVVENDSSDCVIEWQVDGYAADVLSYTVRLMLFQIQIKLKLLLYLL